MTPKQESKKRSVFNIAHENYEKGLSSHAFFKVNNKSLSEDLVQDTFIKTWNYLMKGGKINIMKAFLYHVLNNLIIDEYRRKKTSSLESLVEKGFEPSLEDSERLFNILDGKILILLIKHLPLNYRKIINMRYIQDLSSKEMSSITGQSRNAMAVQVHRGMEKLKILYAHRS